MKIQSVLAASALALTAMSFSGKSTGYDIDAKNSDVTWVGKKVTGEHSGKISIREGNILWNGKTITGGKVVMDMKSMTNTDMEDAGYQQKLIGHLQSDDFFSTEKHPTSTLVITKATPAGKGSYKLAGNLTIKGITKPIEFPATVTVTGKELKAKSKIIVDRTKYDIRYGSGSFFDNLGDKAIDNNFELNVDLKGTTK